MEEKRSNKEEHKKNLMKLYPFLFGFAFLIIMVITVIIVTSSNPSSKNGSYSAAQTGDELVSLEDNKQILAVLKEIDSEAETMRLLDIESGEEVSLTYTGGTDIVDKYEQVIATSQLNIGELVDAYYSVSKSKLEKLQISNIAWEYQGVNNWSIDPSQKILKIVDSMYQYSQNLLVTRKGQVVDISNLNDKDELTIKGHEREIWSIIVTKGHGYIQLEEYEDFVGGTAYVGNGEILPVVSDMIITVQEGSYDVKLEKGSLTGTMKVDVGADEEVIINMGEFKKPVVKTGLIKFIITPEGADLYIDELLNSYESAVELEFGEHAIKVSLGGYSTYTGTLEVDEETKSLKIDLVETLDTIDTEIDVDTEDDSDNSEDDADENITNEENDIDSTENSNTNEDNTGDATETYLKNHIYINEPEGASVYFNGEFKGVAPINFIKINGTHYITLIKAGFETKTYTVEVNEAEDAILSFPDLIQSE